MVCSYSHNTTDVLRPVVSQILMSVIVPALSSFKSTL